MFLPCFTDQLTQPLEQTSSREHSVHNPPRSKGRATKAFFSKKNARPPTHLTLIRSSEHSRGRMNHLDGVRLACVGGRLDDDDDDDDNNVVVDDDLVDDDVVDDDVVDDNVVDDDDDSCMCLPAHDKSR
ncbi:hypothetical protein M438DRAFT_193638 [Aureobasidium pullulans EXF-150]|uniref:Uncharacterized protein n=1 Tax=Aureobasidium pullulans EXF-150 TaxID=1043002 RepID=A0A074XIK1_AURPU|nr:uncharacterized protein M438DRAFT_193638 [Aureobasidium pullulans EXF-150]KEQ85323.1 hypothetical protein M438DRAFT_193638 [Aureobasidium pullulans EXF-150]